MQSAHPWKYCCSVSLPSSQIGLRFHTNLVETKKKRKSLRRWQLQLLIFRVWALNLSWFCCLSGIFLSIGCTLHGRWIKQVIKEATSVTGNKVLFSFHVSTLKSLSLHSLVFFCFFSFFALAVYLESSQQPKVQPLVRYKWRERGHKQAAEKKKLLGKYNRFSTGDKMQGKSLQAFFFLSVHSSAWIARKHLYFWRHFKYYFAQQFSKNYKVHPKSWSPQCLFSPSVPPAASFVHGCSQLAVSRSSRRLCDACRLRPKYLFRWTASRNANDMFEPTPLLSFLLSFPPS